MQVLALRLDQRAREEAQDHYDLRATFSIDGDTYLTNAPGLSLSHTHTLSLSRAISLSIRPLNFVSSVDF